MLLDKSLRPIYCEFLLEVGVAFLGYVELQKCSVIVADLIEQEIRIGRVKYRRRIRTLSVLGIDRIYQVIQQYGVL